MQVFIFMLIFHTKKKKAKDKVKKINFKNSFKITCFFCIK